MTARPPEIISRDGTANFLAESDSAWESGTEFSYAITLDGRVVGSAGLMTRREPGVLEIGYWVHQDYLRRGLATAATRALTDAAFDLPGIIRVEIVHDELNTASEAVPRKLGFTRVGTTQMANPHPRATA